MLDVDASYPSAKLRPAAAQDAAMPSDEAAARGFHGLGRTSGGNALVAALAMCQKVRVYGAGLHSSARAGGERAAAGLGREARAWLRRHLANWTVKSESERPHR